MRWVKLHTKLLNWEWHDIPNMVSLFVHLLMLANWQDKEWHGITIKRGQLATSLKELKKVTGIPTQQLRTCLLRLEKTQEITSKSTNKFRIITICNYDSYQYDESSDQQANQQSTNKQLTTTIEYIDNNKLVVDTARAREGLLEMTMSPAKVESACMAMYISPDDYRTLVREIINDWQFTEEQDWSLKHLHNTLRIKVEENRRKKSQNNGKSQTTTNDGTGQPQTTNPLARAKVFKAYQS